LQSRLEKQAFQADVIERKNKEAIEFLKELITVAIPPRKAGISRDFIINRALPAAIRAKAKKSCNPA